MNFDLTKPFIRLTNRKTAKNFSEKSTLSFVIYKIFNRQEKEEGSGGSGRIDMDM